MTDDRKPEAYVFDLVESEAWDEVASAIEAWHPADIADLIDQAVHDHRTRLFALVRDEVKPDVLVELEATAGSEVLDALTNSELSDIVEDMAPDDAADVLGDLPEERSERVLELMEKEESEDVRKLLEYDEDSAGGIMTTDVVMMQENQTAQEAIEAIAYLDTSEKFYHANIVDSAGAMIGFIDIWELLRERDRGRRLGDLVHRDFVAANVDMDQEEVARLMRQYDLDVLPVVDMAGTLVGRITGDDVLDVLEEEATEDIFKLAGSDDAELESGSVVRSCMVRLPWLFVTLVGSFVTSSILRQYHHYIAGIMVLGAFVPAVLAMGGNTGIQSSTLIVRSLALGTIRRNRVFSILRREIFAGVLMGCICGLLLGVFAHHVIRAGNPLAGSPVSQLGVIVAVALCCAMTFAAVFGALVPLVLDRLNVDPAMASGPFITMANDISALLIYFGVTIVMISRLL